MFARSCKHPTTFVEYVVVMRQNDVVWRQNLAGNLGVVASGRVKRAMTATDLRVEVLHHLMLVTHE